MDIEHNPPIAFETEIANLRRRCDRCGRCGNGVKIVKAHTFVSRIMVKTLQSGGHGAIPGTWKQVSKEKIDTGHSPDQVTGEVSCPPSKLVVYRSLPGHRVYPIGSIAPY